MQFSITHTRGFVGSNITVSVQAQEKEFIRSVNVDFDGDDLDDYQAPDATQSYTREFTGVGDAGPGAEHTLIVTAIDQNQTPHSSTTQWTDVT